MKHKFLSFALMAAIGSTMLFSCQTAEEPVVPGDLTTESAESSNGDLEEYTISVNIPDEMRTRSVTGSIGESGLYEWPKAEIKTLAIMRFDDGKYKTSYTSTRNTTTEPFTLTFKIEESLPDEMSFMFAATDNDKSVELTNQNNYLTIKHDKLNNITNSSNLNFIFNDGFIGKLTVTKENISQRKTLSVTLKRPFAQIHVLCDDLMEEISDLYLDYPQGFITYAGFGSEIPNSTNKFDNFIIPTGIQFDNDNTFKCTSYNGMNLDNCYFKNDIKNNPFKTVFKNRNMHYFTSFFVAASNDESGYTYQEEKLDKLNILVVPTNNLSTPSFNSAFNSSSKTIISVPLPEEGIKANHVYVVYNKAASDGGKPWLDPKYDFKITAIEDAIWDTPHDEYSTDKLSE